MKIYLIIIFLIWFQFCQSQQYVPFIDEVKLTWGIKEQATGKITALPKFPKFYDFQDTLFLFQTKDQTYGGVNERGQLILPFSKNPTYFLRSNPEHCGKPAEYAIKDPNGRKSYRLYLIDMERNCLPSEYYACPSWKKTKSDSLSEYLKLIQEGERVRYKMEIDSAVIFCKKAIDLMPDKSYAYFWGANLFVDNWQEGIRSGNNRKYSDYFNWVEQCFNKALELEGRDNYRFFILQAQRMFYRDTFRNPQKVKAITSEIKIIRKRIQNNMCPIQGKGLLLHLIKLKKASCWGCLFSIR